MYKLWQTYKTSYLLFVLFLLQIQNWHFRCINSNTRCDLREWKYLKRAIQHDIFKHSRLVVKMALSRWSMTYYFDAIYIKHAFWYLKKLFKSNYCNHHVIHAAEFINFIVYIYIFIRPKFGNPGGFLYMNKILSSWQPDDSFVSIYKNADYTEIACSMSALYYNWV